ncbi:hypothetical protein KEM48_001323 [Puccinia striiformis f. sp. tritici PST-130]|uniref:Uncharacterized protein n=1 Tax=Puccinia striiformis f. sp. tritici PST-78 TaxID=1165861 RepID=A0A0L0VYL9_9BASI|nr:hypothetical protein KEM48_001323 [Puccinia striiformis f. sp. tritici PST-130]KNF04361.1 hypothetical protein PSTG_02276 [Puccinia striiformis f. sp. tritici PST-78]
MDGTRAKHHRQESPNQGQAGRAAGAQFANEHHSKLQQQQQQQNGYPSSPALGPPSSSPKIEFQMQGEGLVEIYLAYDESVFALELTTVPVREVGIGRIECRAARREREGAASDLASTYQYAPCGDRDWHSQILWIHIRSDRAINRSGWSAYTNHSIHHTIDS